MFTVTTGWFMRGRGQVMLTLQVTQFKYSSPGCFEQAAAETRHHLCLCNELYSPGQLSREVREATNTLFVTQLGDRGRILYT
jgi:hypothetical protein